jgi:hypothetical protein
LNAVYRKKLKKIRLFKFFGAKKLPFIIIVACLRPKVVAKNAAFAKYGAVNCCEVRQPQAGIGLESVK